MNTYSIYCVYLLSTCLTPYINKTLRNKKQNLHRLLIQAKHTGDASDWLIYKDTKATVNKEISQNKTNYINKKT